MPKDTGMKPHLKGMLRSKVCQEHLVVVVVDKAVHYTIDNGI